MFKLLQRLSTWLTVHILCLAPQSLRYQSVELKRINDPGLLANKCSMRSKKVRNIFFILPVSRNFDIGIFIFNSNLFS